jgi:biotin carboxylase
VAKSASGILNVVITERAPGGSWDPEATFSNTLDFFQAWRSSSGAIMRLQAGIIQGNRITIVASQMIQKKVAWGDKQGLAIFNVDYECYERSTDDQFVLMFS